MSPVYRGAEVAHCPMAGLWPHTFLPDPRSWPRGGLPVGLKRGAQEYVLPLGNLPAGGRSVRAG